MGPRLASETSKEFFDDELTNNNQPDIQKNSTFYFSQLSVENVALTLGNLESNKSTGLDKIPAKILKLSSGTTVPSLTHIFAISHLKQVFILITANELVLFQFIRPRIKENGKIIDLFRFCQL